MVVAASPDLLTMRPIGFARTVLASKVEAARQPRAAGGAPGRIDLLPGRSFEHALEDLQGWERIWVVFWFHLNASWRPKVLPPRSTTGRKGVFATRSPHRPNPIGLSSLQLERVEGLSLYVKDLDLVDGTPVLDIKPYVPYTDAHPQARSGWLEDGWVARPEHAPPDPIAPFQVEFAQRASEQASWIELMTGLALRDRICSTLALGPTPHPYRRIKPLDDGFQLAIKEWRARFTVAGRAVHVSEIASGFRDLHRPASSAGTDGLQAVHRQFVATFGPPG